MGFEVLFEGRGGMLFRKCDDDFRLPWPKFGGVSRVTPVVILQTGGEVCCVTSVGLFWKGNAPEYVDLMSKGRLAIGHAIDFWNGMGVTSLVGA